MNSKVGNLARRRPEFEPGAAGVVDQGSLQRHTLRGLVVAVKLKKLNDADGSQIQWLSDAAKNQLLSSFVYNTK